LNTAFLASPLVSLLLPAVITRDVVVLWWVNAIVLAGSYLLAYYQHRSTVERANGTAAGLTAADGSDGAEGDSSSRNDGAGAAGALNRKWVGILRALDYGAGRERGARK
jgi:hypothetical protein